MSSDLQKLFRELECNIWLQHYLTNGYVTTETRVEFVCDRVWIFKKRYETGLDDCLISSLNGWQ